MSGLRLPTEDRQALECEVRQLVLKRLDGVSPHGSRQEAVAWVCGCSFLWNCCDPPGELLDLKQIDPIPWPGDPRMGAPIAVYTPSNHDVWKMTLYAPDVQHGDPDLPQDQMLVGLRIDTTLDPDQWAKEIDGWAVCECGVPGYKLNQDHPTVGYQWMTINQAEVDTLVFREATAPFGWFRNVAYFESGEFWKLLGGLIITFDWMFSNP